MNTTSRKILTRCAVVAAIGLLFSSSWADAEEKKKDAAVERTRREVRMLDDIYKTGVVLVTQNFVDGDSPVPAGTVFKKLFAAAKEKGWHEVRLLDATGDPISDENVAKDKFEKEAIKALLAGKSYVDEVQVRDGKRHLRAATAIPVVMQKCVACHDNYKKAGKGQAIGALSYTIEIQE